ncbi:MAG: hypothetical protein JXB33_02100 [Clostridia bacterium]|nr:hypothetical protein [Clostridia bacterium]
MKVIERKASDNKYLHRDFHISMNMLMDYICSVFGENALIEYLVEFSSAFHAPRKEFLIADDLASLESYFREIYKKEEWPVEILMEDKELVITQESCPGISHIRKAGLEPIKQYRETYGTVYEAMCAGTPYEYRLEYFDDEKGACRQRFFRRNMP